MDKIVTLDLVKYEQHFLELLNTCHPAANTDKSKASEKNMYRTDLILDCLKNSSLAFYFSALR